MNLLSLSSQTVNVNFSAMCILIMHLDQTRVIVGMIDKLFGKE